MRVPFHRLSKLLACGRAAPRAVLTLALAVAACGGGADGGELDQTDTSGVEFGETTDDGSPQDVVEDTDTSPEGDSDVSVETDDAEIDTTEAEVADETTTPPPDADQDGVPDTEDQCPEGRRDWTSSPSTDRDGDGCHDTDEDTDDDQDGVLDEDDACPSGAIGWTPDPDNDHDGDGCHDEDEDTDDDNDGIPDDLDECPRGANDWMSDETADGDTDGCRDLDEDLDLDGDGVTDDVDTCPGLFDPEQIDAWPPFGPGQGDICAEPCREIVRLETIEVSDPSNVRPLGSLEALYPHTGPELGWVQVHEFSQEYRESFQYQPFYPSAASYRRLTLTERSSDNTYVCLFESVEIASAAPPALRIEVSAAGTLIGEPAGLSNLGVLMFPAGSPNQDLDGDSLLEPWNYQSRLWMFHNSVTPRLMYETYKAPDSGEMRGKWMRLTGPDHAALTAVYTGTTGMHVYLTRSWSGSSVSRVRIFVEEQLVEDFEVPNVAANHSVYLGEYFHDPKFFVMRKRCAVNNTLCARDADCPGGPCVLRTVPRAL